jgi:hypothetical protein
MKREAEKELKGLIREFSIKVDPEKEIPSQELI